MRAYSSTELAELSRQKRQNISNRLKTHSRGLHITNGKAPIIGDPASCVIWWAGDEAACTLLPQHALCTSCRRNPWHPSYNTGEKDSISTCSQVRVSAQVLASRPQLPSARL